MEQPMDEVQVEVVETPEEEQDFGAPRGAVWFAVIMLLFYIGYYMLHWYEIFVLRATI